jgi:hypothetical protein
MASLDGSTDFPATVHGSDVPVIAQHQNIESSRASDLAASEIVSKDLTEVVREVVEPVVAEAVAPPASIQTPQVFFNFTAIQYVYSS